MALSWPSIDAKCAVGIGIGISGMGSGRGNPARAASAC
jgi:hypothetical protein